MKFLLIGEKLPCAGFLMHLIEHGHTWNRIDAPATYNNAFFALRGTDVVVMDAGYCTSVEFIEQMRDCQDITPIAIYSTDSKGEDRAEDLLHAGANGYIGKDLLPSVFLSGCLSVIGCEPGNKPKLAAAA